MVYQWYIVINKLQQCILWLIVYIIYEILGCGFNESDVFAEMLRVRFEFFFVVASDFLESDDQSRGAARGL